MKLVPQDDVTIHCLADPNDSELGRVLKEQRTYIEASVKQPLIITESGRAVHSDVARVRGGGTLS